MKKENKEKKVIKINLSTAIILSVIAITIIAALIGVIIIGVGKKIDQETNNNKISASTENKSTTSINEIAKNEENKSTTTQTATTENTISKNNASANQENKINSDEYFVVYDGYEIPKKTGVPVVDDMKYTKANEEKYNTKYYNYQNSKYTGEKNGKMAVSYGDGGYDNSVGIVQNIDRVAISKKYDAVPRTGRRERSLPNELKDMADYPSVKVDTIDLDGDGKEEHIVAWRISYKKGDIGDGKPQESSGMALYDSNYKKVADLAELKNGFWGNSLNAYNEGQFTEDNLEEYRKYLDLDKNEYIDIDNDGVMEIIINLPTYEGTAISIVKYDRGTFSGEKNVQAKVGGGVER